MVLLNIGCKHPELYRVQGRCCMCAGEIRTCGCRPIDAINHYVQCHIDDYECQIWGHPSIGRMLAIGMPFPTAACRKCHQTITLQTL